MSFLNQREGSGKMRCKNVYFFDIKRILEEDPSTILREGKFELSKN